MYRTISVLGILLVIGGAAASAFAFLGRLESFSDLPRACFSIGGHAFTLGRLADTETARERGLSGTKTPTPILFVFEHDDRWGFWMKEMRYSIDILWFDAARALVHYEENVHPDSYPSVFRPRVPARYVVELPAGSVSAHMFVLGDMLSHECKSPSGNASE